MRPGTLAWILSGGFVITATTGLVLLASVPDEVLRREGNSLPLTAAFLVGTLAFSVVGAIIAQHQPRNPIGWLFVALAVVEGWSGLAFALGVVLPRGRGAARGDVRRLVRHLGERAGTRVHRLLLPALPRRPAAVAAVAGRRVGLPGTVRDRRRHR